MSSRRPLQPIPARPANVASTRYARTTTTTPTADGPWDMEAHAQDDVQTSDSVISGLTSLSGEDEFERFMIEKEREEQRQLQGSGQPFRKARTHPRVRLTMDNLERSDAQDKSGGASGPARTAVKSPPSSSGSTHSDPAIHAPAGWGRKGRTSRDWMRTITRDAPKQTPAPPVETPGGQRAAQDGAHAPRRQGDDSPLSHKSFSRGPPGAARQDSTGELDLTFDMNEASMLVSTPYIPRNNKLDDIREREIESLREQGLASARLERIREHSPEETRRPRPSFAHSTDTASAAPLAPAAELPPHEEGSPVRRLRRRTNSWQSLSKSQPDLGKENSPISVYTKSVETLGMVERDVVASAERQPTMPFTSRRTDSQDLLRRLARVSNTPSPKATAPRPHTKPTPQPHSSSQTAAADSSYTPPPPAEGEAVKDMPAQDTAPESTATQPEQFHRARRHDTPHDGTTPDVPSSAPTPADAENTPIPTEQPVQNPRTPYVMGGWVDTPGPRTAHKPINSSRRTSQSPEPSDSGKPFPPDSSTAPVTAEQPATKQPAEESTHSVPRPQLPTSALHALVQEARAHHDYGDDTIHSLEELLGPFSENEVDEDTLEGLALPTSAPRSEAERERQAETVNIHRLRQHLRATETNVRDVSRGMRRLGTMVEHSRVEVAGDKVPVIVRDVGTHFSPWIWFRSFFWDEHLKTQRQAKDAPLKMWGGVTLFGLLLTLSFIWWASETVACEMFCHPEYASYSPYPFAVNMDAPKRGVVIPTLVYRTLFRSWSTPIVAPFASLSSWIWSTLWSLGSGINVNGLSRWSYESAADFGSAAAAHTQASWIKQEETHEEDAWDWSMAEDEILRR